MIICFPSFLPSFLPSFNIIFCFYSSPYPSLPINVITRVTSPTADQTTTSEQREGTKTPVPLDSDGHEPLETEELCLGEIHPNEDYIVSHTNGPATEYLLPIKSQTTRHRFLSSGQKKTLSNSVFGAKKEKIKVDDESRGMMANGARNVAKGGEEMVKDSQSLGKEELMKSSIGYLNCEKTENNLGRNAKPPDLGSIQ